MWYRIFSRDPLPVSPVQLTEHLHAAGYPVEPHFRGDDLGWTGGELRLPGGGTPIYLDRFLTTEDNMRAELNAFAAELELLDFNPNSPKLMQHVIQSQQLVTLRKPIDHADESRLEGMLLAACRYLAEPSDGVFQIDGQGWFAADGTLMLQEY